MKRKTKWTSAVVGLAALIFVSSAYAMTFTHRGIYCQTGRLGVICMRKDGHGYGVGLSRKAIVVTDATGKVVFKGYNGG